MPDYDLVALVNSDITHEFEAELGVPTGFLAGLEGEDDWSFVIKAHALLEAALTHAVAEDIGRQALLPVLARLETSDPEGGKVAFARVLELIAPDEQRLVVKLSELRNRLVHDVRQTAFAFPSYVSSLDGNAVTASADAFSLHLRVVPGSAERLDAKTVRDSSVPAFRKAPKAMIWASLVALIWLLNWRKTLARIDNVSRSIGQQLFAEISRAFGGGA